MTECKTYLFKEEFCKELGIPINQVNRRLSDLLEWLKVFFDYDFISGKGVPHVITIKEQRCEYEPLPRKTKVPEIKKFYYAETDHILKYKPRNTGANVAREINKYNNVYHHAEGTIANYIRPHIKANYVIDDKQWCRVNYETYTYEPIDEDQLKFLKRVFKKYLDGEKTANIIADVEAGYMSKEECYKSLSYNYNDAILEFKNKYGFRPFKAGQLKKCAWTIEP